MIARVDTSVQREQQRGEHQYFLDGQRATELIDVPGAPDFKRGIDLVADGKPAEAAAAFEDLVRKYPKNSIAYYNLGVTYKFLGKYILARKNLRKACKLKGDPRYREQLKEIKQLEEASLRER